MSSGVARVFAFGLGIGFGAVLGVNVVLAGASGSDEKQIQWRVEATATAVRHQAQTRAMATAVAKATATAVQSSQNAARCAASRGAQVDATLVGEPGISYTSYSATGTVRNLCHYPLEVRLQVMAITGDGSPSYNSTHVNPIIPPEPLRLAPGEIQSFNYPLGRFPDNAIPELYVVPIARVP
jgi:hypothetical protein